MTEERRVPHPNIARINFFSPENRRRIEELLELTFPGWMDKVPQVIVAAVDAVMEGRDFITTPSGLLVVSDETKRAMAFAKSLDIDHLSIMLGKIETMGWAYRSRTGAKRALVGDALGLTPYPHT